jgi:hypothetical protein
MRREATAREVSLLRNFRLYVLKMCGWNRTAAASILGQSQRNIQRFCADMRRGGYPVDTTGRSGKTFGRHPTTEEIEKIDALLSDLERGPM